MPHKYVGTWKVEVVRLGKIGHPDKLLRMDVTTIKGRPVCFGKGEFKEGDLAVYIPIDSIVDTRLPAFSWLEPNFVPPGLGASGQGYEATEHDHLVALRTFAGIPSYGFIVPIDSIRNPEGDEEFSEGQSVAHLLGVRKYNPEPEANVSMNGDVTSCPLEDRIPEYDIDHYYEYEGKLMRKEDVVITEKIHGANGRWVYTAGQLYSGSRNKFRQKSIWNEVAEKYELEAVLSRYPGLVLFGEVYGAGVQNLTYGKEEPSVVFFDIYDTMTGLWWHWDEFAAFCNMHHLPMAPVLYRGPYNAGLMPELSEGITMFPLAEHVREGAVIKPTKDRFDHDLKMSRVVLKVHGDGYLALNNKRQYAKPSLLARLGRWLGRLVAA